MANRRLAEEHLQPKEFSFTAENKAWADKVIARYPAGRQQSAVIPLLWRAQEQHYGWLPQKAIEHVADMLGMAKIRVLEVATFYTMFLLSPVGKKAHVQVCGTTPCRLRGADALFEVCARKIHPEPFHISADGNYSWEEVECLGACVNAPMVLIWNDTYEDLTAETFEKVLDGFTNGNPAKPGPQIDRHFSAPIGGPSTLTDPAIYAPPPNGGGTALLDADAKKVTPQANVQEMPAPVETVAKAAAAEGLAPPAVAGAAAAASLAGAAAPTPAVSAAETLARTEEKEIAATLATLPKGATAEEKANAVGTRPAALAEARGGQGDNLQRIKGIGPVNEGKLHALGIYHFDQIGNWSRQEIRWVGTYLSFPGRIDREDWVSQARTLASGGEPASGKKA